MIDGPARRERPAGGRNALLHVRDDAVVHGAARLVHRGAGPVRPAVRERCPRCCSSGAWRRRLHVHILLRAAQSVPLLVLELEKCDGVSHAKSPPHRGAHGAAARRRPRPRRPDRPTPTLKDRENPRSPFGDAPPSRGFPIAEAALDSRLRGRARAPRAAGRSAPRPTAAARPAAPELGVLVVPGRGSHSKTCELSDVLVTDRPYQRSEGPRSRLVARRRMVRASLDLVHYCHRDGRRRARARPRQFR